MLYADVNASVQQVVGDGEGGVVVAAIQYS